MSLTDAEQDQMDEDDLITVHTVRYDGGTIAVGVGTTDDGREVTFGGDHRAMGILAEAIEEGGPQPAIVPPWARLG
jgi:hypothetical protein